MISQTRTVEALPLQHVSLVASTSWCYAFILSTWLLRSLGHTHLPLHSISHLPLHSITHLPLHSLGHSLGHSPSIGLYLVMRHMGIRIPTWRMMYATITHIRHRGRLCASPPPPLSMKCAQWIMSQVMDAVWTLQLHWTLLVSARGSERRLLHNWQLTQFTHCQILLVFFARGSIHIHWALLSILLSSFPFPALDVGPFQLLTPYKCGILLFFSSSFSSISSIALLVLYFFCNSCISYFCCPCEQIS